MRNACEPVSAAVTLASSQLEVIILPGKGADIYSFVDVASGMDVHRVHSRSHDTISNGKVSMCSH
jgi:hypothetical protein